MRESIIKGFKGMFNSKLKPEEKKNQVMGPRTINFGPQDKRN